MPKISQIDGVPCQAEVRILQKITLKILGFKRTKYLPSSNQDERTDELTSLLIMAKSLMSRNARNGENCKHGKTLREVRRSDILQRTAWTEIDVRSRDRHEFFLISNGRKK